MNKCHFDFLRYCLGVIEILPQSALSIDWVRMLNWAERQSIVGVIFEGINRAGKSLNIPQGILFKWIGEANLIEKRNKLLNERCIEISDLLRKQGFDSCILKGQGNAQMYSNPFSRIPGDIDLWVKPEKDGIRSIIKYVRNHHPRARAEYHHIDYGEYNGVEVEVHYRPSFSNNLIYNSRLQKWFKAHAWQQYSHIVEIPGNAGSICIPTFEFNIIFQLSHIYRHLLQEGIGLRQVIDYYYLLKSEGSSKMADMLETLQYLGLMKIAGAMMWVLNEVLGLPEKYLIAPKNEKHGRLLLSEIMKGGNFGHYNVDNQKANNAIKKNLQRIKRDIRMMRQFPSECLWEPIFRMYHWIWRLRYNYLYL